MAPEPQAAERLPDFDGLLDWPRLQEWVAAQPSLPGTGPVTAVEELTGGSQNHIFLLTRGDARLVLRRPPRHPRANSDETMVREARVLAALAGRDVPHPELYAVCDRTDVIGVCFYLMAPVAGFTPVGALPGRYGDEPAWRRRLGFELVEAAARLGALPPAEIGLADFGKPERWLERQVERWRAQLDGYSRLEGYPGPEIPGVDAVGEWLDAHRPAECVIGVIHGDYHFANVMMAGDEPRLAAIVDWELSTLGDPLLDLGWLLAACVEEGDPPGKGAPFTPWEGMPTRAELVARYGEVSGRDVRVMPWFFVLACYKLGILLEGTHARACAGQAPREIGDALHALTLWLFAKARQEIGAHG